MPGNRLRMLSEYLKNFRAIGAVVPDSKSCVDTLVSRVDFAKSKTIVEWGGGTGTVSRKILERLAPDARLFTFESNASFHPFLEKIQDPRFTLVKATLQATPATMRDHGIASIDAVISTVPSSQIDSYGALVQTLLGELLKPDGVFVQYMHVTAYLKGYFLRSVLAKRFQTVWPDWVWMNLPPTLVCSATGIKPPAPEQE